MKNRDMENLISRTVEGLVPSDAFTRIAAAVPASDEERGLRIMTTKTVKFKKFMAPAIAACALLVAGIGGTLYYQSHMAVDSVISIDVNPGIELKTNKQNRVLDVIAANEDGKAILDGMDLKKAELKVAVNAIVGSMVQKGYALNEQNGILVTVQNKDAHKAALIRGEVNADIDKALDGYQINAPIINQTIADFDAVDKFAADNGVSRGKAAFVLALAKKDATLDPAALAKMSVAALAETVIDKKLDIRDIADYDLGDSLWENIDDAIDEDDEAAVDAPAAVSAAQAKDIALADAGIAADKATFIKVERDIDDGTVKYEVEFYADGMEYEYDISAADGRILEKDKELDDDRSVNATAPQTAKPTEALISADRAKEIALAYAKASAADAKAVKVELDSDDGVAEYQVEFRIGNVEYDYDIRATDGHILSAERDIDD